MYASLDEIKKVDERLEKLTKGIGFHFETLQAQLGDRFDQIEKQYTERIEKLLEGK